MIKHIKILLSTWILLMLTVPIPAFAGWEQDGIPLAPYRESIANNYIEIAEDGYGGAYYVWQDIRNSPSPDIYAQRFDSTGTHLWQLDGIPIHIGGDTQHAQIVSNGPFGAIILWKDSLNDFHAARVSKDGSIIWKKEVMALAWSAYSTYESISDSDGGIIVGFKIGNYSGAEVFVQRIDRYGNINWGPAGLLIGSFVGFNYDFNIAEDGTGGVLVTWAEEGASEGDAGRLLAQKIDASGTIQWTSGGVEAFYRWYENPDKPKIISDGTGGAFITFRVSDLGPLAEYSDIRAQRVSSYGNPMWTADGISICSYSGDQDRPMMVTDGASGAIIVWEDWRSGSLDFYAQHLTTGGVVWDTDGILAAELISEEAHGPDIISDSAGGGIILWGESRGSNSNIYAQRLNASGTRLWGLNGKPICDGAWTEYRQVISGFDFGGAIIAWRDARDYYDIYTQRIDLTGTEKWISTGVEICPGFGGQYEPRIISDNAGGMIAVWEDKRGDKNDIYAQRTDAEGNILWSTYGDTICADENNQYNPQIAPDGSGGAIITWEDDRSGNLDIYAQRISQNGTVLWIENGSPVCDNLADQFEPQIAQDGSGGAVIIWRDERTENDLYAQRIDNYGNTQWVSDIPVCTAVGDPSNHQIVSADSLWIAVWQDMGRGGQLYAQMIGGGGGGLWGSNGMVVCPDGIHFDHHISFDGGAIVVTWEEWSSGQSDILAQKIDMSGERQWGSPDSAFYAATICASAGKQFNPQIASYGFGGAIITWQDERSGTDWDIYAQRIDASGTILGTVNGDSICTVPYESAYNPRIAPLVSGGAVITWRDDRNGTDVYAQRIDISGNILWGPDGEAICDREAGQSNPRIISDGSEGAIIVWEDYRNGGYADIYAHRIKGVVCSVDPTVINFGVVDLTEWAESSFDIQNIGDVGPLTGYVHETSSHYSIVQGHGAFSLEPGDIHHVIVRFAPQSDSLLSCSVETGISICGDVSCSGTGRGPICQIDPVDIYFPKPVIVGSSVDTFFTITNLGGGILSDTVSISCPGYSIISGNVYTLAGLESKDIWVRFAPTSVDSFVCTIETGSTLCGDVDIHGMGKEWQMCVVNPSNIDFGRVEVGSANYSTFSIKNIGSGTVDVDANESCPDYSIISGGDPTGLNHNDSIEVNFQFNPTSSGFSKCLIETGSTLCDRLILVAGGADGLRVYNARDPGAIIEAGDHATVGGANGVVVSGHTAYVADRGIDGESGLVIFDISDPANPDSIGAYHTAGEALNVYVSGDYAYVADSGGGLRVIDVSDPANPDSVGHWNHLSARDVVVAGGYAYLANGGWGLRVFDVSDPGNPSVLATLDTPGYAQGLFISGNHAFVGDGASGLRIIDISNPAIPVDVGNYDTPGSARYVCVRGDYAYVADNETGLLIMDVSDPAVPILVGSYDTPHLAGYVKVSGVNAYVSDTWDGAGVAFHVIDVSEPSNPVLLESTSAHSSIGIAVREGGDVACVGYAGYEHAVINSVTDVPDEQGGYVRIDMTRSIYDFVAEKALPIASYQVWRRVDSPSLLQAFADGGSERKEVKLREAAAAVEEDIKLPDWPLTELQGRYFLQSPAAPAADGFPPGTWEFMHSVFAAQQENYLINTTTLADSSGSGIPYSVYVITAHTTTPSIWFTSAPDSGYSVDNIAPAPPLGFAVSYNTGSGNELTWDPSPEPDFHYYRIYRDTDENFTPGPGNLVHETAAEAWMDPEYDGWDVHYKITALDYVENESDAASPGSTTGDDVPLVPKAFALHQNHPNPFNPTTTIRFDLPRAVHVKLTIYNVKGELVSTIVDRHMTEGRKEVSWTAKDNRGRAVSSGIYFYRLVAGDFMQTKKMVLLR